MAAVRGWSHSLTNLSWVSKKDQPSTEGWQLFWRSGDNGTSTGIFYSPTKGLANWRIFVLLNYSLPMYYKDCSSPSSRAWYSQLRVLSDLCRLWGVLALVVAGHSNRGGSVLSCLAQSQVQSRSSLSWAHAHAGSSENKFLPPCTVLHPLPRCCSKWIEMHFVHLDMSLLCTTSRTNHILNHYCPQTIKVKVLWIQSYMCTWKFLQINLLSSKHWRCSTCLDKE